MVFNGQRPVVKDKSQLIQISLHKKVELSPTINGDNSIHIIT